MILLAAPLDPFTTILAAIAFLGILFVAIHAIATKT